MEIDNSESSGSSFNFFDNCSHSKEEFSSDCYIPSDDELKTTNPNTTENKTQTLDINEMDNIHESNEDNNVDNVSVMMAVDGNFCVDNSQLLDLGTPNLLSTEEILEKLRQKCDIFKNEVMEIEKYYRDYTRQRYFRWFSKYAIHRKIKPNFLKFNLNKIRSLLKEKYKIRFPEFNIEKFVNKVDLDFEGKLFDYPIYEIMKVDDFIKRGNIDDFFNENCFMNNDCYNQFLKIINQKYSVWIKEFIIYCLNEPKEAENMIRINKKSLPKTKFRNCDQNMFSEMNNSMSDYIRSQCKGDYIKLFWSEVFTYSVYFSIELKEK